MLLYLVQHGKATSKDENPERPLTDRGRRDTEAVMLLMQRAGAINATRIFHSGKLRAAETAGFIGDRLDVPTAEAEGLHPTDDPAVWVDRLRDTDEDTMLVGHLPHLPRLASALITGDPDVETVSFANAGVVCLGRGRDGGWTVRWAVTPYLVR